MMAAVTRWVSRKAAGWLMLAFPAGSPLAGDVPRHPAISIDAYSLPVVLVWG
jgi:hypothetical protein